MVMHSDPHSRPRILLVNAEVLFAEEIRARLQHLGYRVIDALAGSGEQAIDVARRERPDLVLLDILLKGTMDAIETAERICRELDLPVVFLTAHADQVALHHAAGLSAFGHVVEPFAAEDLMTAIDAAMHRHTCAANLRDATLATIVTGVQRDADGGERSDRVRYMNHAAEGLTGWRLSEAQGLALGDVLTLIDAEGRPLDLSEAALQQPGLLHVDMRVAIVDRYGATVGVRAYASPVLNAQGATKGVSLSIDTVSASDRAEQKFRRVLEVTPDAMLVVDAHGRIVLANRCAEEMFGYPMAELLGKSVEMLTPPAVRERHGTERMHFFASPRVRPMGLARELHGLRKDGSLVPVEISLGPIHTENGVWALAAVRDVSERKRAEADRRSQEERTRAVFEAGLVGMAIISPQRTFLEVNDALADMLGVSKQSLIGTGWDESTHLGDLPDNVRGLERAIAGERDSYRGQKRFVRADGTTLFVEISGRAVRDDDQSLRYFVVLVRDVTEQKLAEDALRASEDRYRTLIEQASDGIFIFDRHGRFLEVNAAGAQMLGRSGAQLLEMSIRDVVAHDEQPRIEPERARLLGRDPVKSTWRFRRADGTFFHGEVVARRLPHARGLAFVRDVSQRMRIEEALRKSEANLNEAQILAGLGSWEFDLGKHVMTWSEEAQAIYELSPSERAAVRDRLLERVHPDDRERVERCHADSLRDRTQYDIEHRLLMPDGRVKYVHERGRAEYDADGAPVRTIGIVQDITERWAADAKLRENEALLSAVIRSASDAVISTDVQGRITMFNPAAECIFGRTAASMVGQRIGVLIPARARASHDENLASFASSQVASRSMGVGRVQGVRADGAVLELESSISQVTINGKQVLTATLRDVTDRVHSENALARYRLELTELTHQLMDQERATANRLAQVLHDQLGQTLSAIRIDFVDDAQFADPGQAARHARVDALIDSAIREVRQVLAELRPTLLGEFGLFKALDNELHTRQPSAGDVRLRIEARPEVESQRWHPDIEYAAFMVAREAVANAVQHAAATLVRVVLDGDAKSLWLEVVDNGRGLPASAATVRAGHLGMVGMRERSIAIGARFEAQSLPEGGTAIRLTWNEAPA